LYNERKENTTLAQAEGQTNQSKPRENQTISLNFYFLFFLAYKEAILLPDRKENTKPRHQERHGPKENKTPPALHINPYSAT
jgi:hypothetical protein